jgi:hypothetical protein
MSGKEVKLARQDLESLVFQPCRKLHKGSTGTHRMQGKCGKLDQQSKFKP